MKQTLLLSLLLFNALTLMSQTINWLPLYEEQNVPDSKPSENLQKTENRPGNIIFTTEISVPTYAVFESKKPNGRAVIIFPGGGYSGTADDHEGVRVAKKLNAHGITAFVVRYRIPNDRYCTNKAFAPLQDAQHAIRFVRSNASKWNIQPNKIGIMGFSAGGHLTATAATLYNFDADAHIDSKNATHGVSTRPDFVALIYPVISFSDDNIVHAGSRENLMGKSPSDEQKRFLSPELQVRSDAPPVFLVHAGNDNVVKVQNSIVFYQACQAKNVLAELHIYPKGGHGFGITNKTTNDKWIESYLNWTERL